MATKIIDSTNLGYLISKIKAAFWSKSDVVNITLADVATTGSYNDLSNKPTIPSASSSTPSMDGTAATGSETAFARGDHVHPSDTSKQDVIDSNHKLSYTLLTDTPTIPAAQVNSDWDASSGIAQILNKPTLATVATSGSYSDLSNTPTIPAAGIPSGGTQGQVLKKSSSTDYAVEWASESGGTPEVYPCTYGTTSQTDIATAVTAGKIPICFYGDNLYIYAGESSAGYSQFSSLLYNTASRIYVKNSTWGNGSITVPSVTLNGSAETSPSFYAPTTAGTQGYVLTSNGSGAPSWAAASASVTPMTNTEIDNAVDAAWV